MSNFQTSHGPFMLALLKVWAVHIGKVILKPVLFIALMGILFLSACDNDPSPTGGTTAAPSTTTGHAAAHKDDDDGCDDKDHGPPRPSTGTYNVAIRGDYNGAGTASVSATSVQVTAQVSNSAGMVSTLSFTAPLNNQHFNGTGTLFGNAMSFSGRVDSPDLVGKGGSILSSQRLVGTFSTTDGRFGRMAGTP